MPSELPTALIANARMYSVAPGAVAAWKRLFAWLIAESGVPLSVVDHAFPAKLSELWARPDLACTFMCGWPYVRDYADRRVVAAPVPNAVFAAGRPLYCTHFVVHRDAPFQSLEETFGHRFAFTIQDSHSGYNAPRHHLLAYRKPGAAPLYREIIGPLTTPRRMLEAIAARQTDVGPLDSFAYALLQRHEPRVAAETRVIASTALVQMPAFVAAPGTNTAIVARLTETLLTLAADQTQPSLRDDLCIAGFARVDAAPWQLAERWAQAAERQGANEIR